MRPLTFYSDSPRPVLQWIWRTSLVCRLSSLVRIYETNISDTTLSRTPLNHWTWLSSTLLGISVCVSVSVYLFVSGCLSVYVDISLCLSPCLCLSVAAIGLK